MQNQIAYFDNAATTFPKPEEVYCFMDKFYRECGVNAGRGQYKLSSMANSMIEETRGLILKLFHCENKQVVFTSTATVALNQILFGLNIPENSNVYISPFEHNAVIRVLHRIFQDRHINIHYLSVSNNFVYDLNDIQNQFENSKPYCVIVSHASNVCGLVAPINEIFTLSKEHDAITVVDMCQTAGLIDTDLSSNIYDYAVFEGHKTLYGPMGIGGFVSKNNISVPPLIYGGTGLKSAYLDMPDEIPVKYEAGSHNIQAIAGLNAALKWIEKTGISSIYEKEKQNREQLINALESHSNITVFNPENAIGVVSCVFDGYSSDSIGQVLSDNDIAVRTGLHCAPDAHKFLETFPAGTVRFSVCYFNDEDDFEKLSEALDYIEENS